MVIDLKYKKTILLTGASGFLGQYILKKLLKYNYKIIVISNRNKKIVKNKKIKIIKLSLLNFYNLQKNLINYKIDHVIHCAWIGVQAKERNDNIQERNIKIAKNLKRFFKTNQYTIKSFISFGSQAEYGLQDGMLKENLCLKPITKYGKTKVKIYGIFKDFFSNKKTRFVWFRVFSGYGESKNTKWIIPNTISKIKKGDKLKFSLGNQVYNFIHLSDIANAVYKALIKPVEGIYNLADKKNYKIKSVIKMIFKASGQKTKPKFGELKYRKDQIMNFRASTKKIQRDLNWKPKISLKKGILNMIKFINSK
jgi:UDP-glucose 4-epimerase